MSIITLFSACEEKKVVLPSSVGRINTLTVVMDNDLWKGQVGEHIRKTFAANVQGLPQQEPLFTLDQLPPKVFEGFVKKTRLFLKVQEDNYRGVAILVDSFAAPQTGAVISAPSHEELIKLIDKYSPRIISKLKEQEIEERQRRIAKSKEDDTKLQEKLGVSLLFPSAYRYAKTSDDFFWIRKDLADGSMEILIYTVPMEVIDKGNNVMENIIKMRDSIGKKYIPGPIEGSYMVTEKAFTPFLFETKIDGKFAYLTKGTWDVENAFMAGPFINYAVRDTANNRYVILEGFVFRPSLQKRDNIFSLRAVIESADINAPTGKK